MSEERKTRSARHVAAGVGQVLLVVIGIHLTLKFVSLPGIDINPPDLPDLPDLPGWLEAVLKTKKYWWPVAIGLLIALGELERQKRKKKEPEA